MGGVHGNEPCGLKAVERLTREFQAGRLSLVRGTLLLVIANEEALRSNVRSVHRNLNRLFKDNSDEPDCYETRRAEQLKELLSRADFVLDLHSTTSASPPFLMCEDDGVITARRMGLERVVLGWAALGSAALSGDTETWARRHGATAFTLECGQHNDPAAAEVAYQAAYRFLRITGLVNATAMDDDPEPLVLRLYGVKLKVDESFTFSRSYNGFDVVLDGEILGRDSQGEHRADRPSRIIFPIDPAKATIGSELYLLAEEILFENANPDTKQNV
jgi:succinylglutamate desuccinylase